MALTREQLVRAAKIERYRRDFELFCREQLWVKPKDPGPVQPLKLNAPQKVIDKAAQEQHEKEGRLRLAILKSRQQGCSTYSSARGLHAAALNNNIVNVVIAHDKPTSQHIFELTRLFYDRLDDDIRPVIRYSNRTELVFENPDDRTRAHFPGRRSKITFTTASNYRAGTGQTIHALHLSEVSKYGDVVETLTQSLFPSVSEGRGTSVILESTGFPTGMWFKDFCEQSKRGVTGYKFIFIPWYMSPEYQTPLLDGEKFSLTPHEKRLVKHHHLSEPQLHFRRRKIATWGDDEQASDRFDIEYPTNEDDSWRSLDMVTFDRARLLDMKKDLRAPERRCEIFPGPELLDDPQGRLSIWKPPQPGRLYDIGVDVAGGNEDGDFSVAQVITRDKPHEQVARWRGQLNPIDYGKTCFWLGMYYNTAQVAVECDGIGFATNGELQRLGYPYCLTPEHRVLTLDLRWVPIGDLAAGDQLLAFDENSPTPRLLRKFRAAQVIGCEPRRAKVHRMVLSDGTELVATGEHPWLVVQNGGTSQQWQITSKLRVGQKIPKFFQPWPIVRSYDAGWMAGILDGEGSVGRYSIGRDTEQRMLAIVQKPGVILDRARELLSEWGIPFYHYVGGEKAPADSLMIGNKAQIARLLGMSRPKRLLPKITSDFFGSMRAPAHVIVEAIEAVGEREVIMMGTTTQTYFAEGYPTHNCYIWRQREKVVPKLSSWSGWRTQQDSKRYMVSVGKHQIIHREVIVHCPITHHEMTHFATYITAGGQEAWGGSGTKDDEVMSLLIALVVSSDETFGMEEFAPVAQEKPAFVDPALTDTKGISGRVESRDVLEQLAAELRGVD